MNMYYSYEEGRVVKGVLIVVNQYEYCPGGCLFKREAGL